jgi:DNA-binding MarR family transcriptional regulator
MKTSAAAHLRSVHHSVRASNRLADALQAVRGIVEALSRSARAVEQETGVTNAQLFLLQQIRAKRNPTVNDLAALAMTSQSTVSIVLSRLERRGLVARARSATDARSVVLRLTARGARVVRRAPTPATSEALHALGRLTPSELRSLSRGLAALGRELGLHEAQPSMLFEKREGREIKIGRAASRTRVARPRRTQRRYALARPCFAQLECGLLKKLCEAPW